MKIKKFEDLPVWRLSLKITRDVYDLTSKKTFARDFGLRDQLRRAMISISSNIVEGFEKENNNEFIRYLKIAKGSTGEARNQIYIALAVGHISQSEFNSVNNDLLSLRDQIARFISYLVTQRKKGNFKNK